LVDSSPLQIVGFALNILRENGLCAPPGLKALLYRLHGERHHFAGAAEVASLLLAWTRSQFGACPTDDIPSPWHNAMPANEARFGDWLAQLSPDEMKRARAHLMGSQSGPPISVLMRVIGLKQSYSVLKSLDGRGDE
jgi:hypothetical protein